MMSLPEIEELVKGLENESKQMKKNLFKLCWFMRGSITMEEAFQMDWENREIIYKIIEENLETTKESGLPFF